MYSFAKVRKSLQLAVVVAIWDLYDILILFLFWDFGGFLGVSMGQRLRDVLLCPKLGTLLCFFQGGCSGATSRSPFHLETFHSRLYTGFMGSPFKFVSWNVKGLNHPVKRKKIFTHLKQLKTDIIFLQGTHVRSSEYSKLMACWAGQPPSRQRQEGSPSW